LKGLLDKLGVQEEHVKVVCSPFTRCLQTAAGLVNGLELKTNLQVQVREELSEFLLG